MITEFLDKAFTGFCSIDEYVQLMQKLHALNISLPRNFCPIQTLKKYEENACRLGVVLPKALTELLLPKIYSWSVSTLLQKKTPCHLDPQFENVRRHNQHLFLVDWEFAAMSDPIFDLASMSASEELSSEEMLKVLKAYLLKDPEEMEWNRFLRLRVIADVRMCLFCYISSGVKASQSSVYIDFAKVFLSSAISINIE